MLCQVCGKRNYRVKITRIVNGEAEELKVCDECAAQISPYHAKISSKISPTSKQAVENLLKDLLSQKEAGAVVEVTSGSSEEESGAQPICVTCGLEYSKYKQTYMLGCPDCYDAFGQALLGDIQRIHGALKHVGGRVTPDNSVLDAQARAKQVRLELEEAIDREDFTSAARLRDELREIEAKMNVESEQSSES